MVWNEAFAAGKPFPETKVPIEVWSLGRFMFKGIAGTCKVSPVAPLGPHQLPQLNCLTLVALQVSSFALASVDFLKLEIRSSP